MSADYFNTFTSFPLGTQGQNLRLPGAVNISSATFVNQTDGTVSVFPSGNASGTALVTIASNAQVTLPIAQLPALGITSTATGGSIYVHLTDANIASLSSSVPTTAYPEFLLLQQDVLTTAAGVTDNQGRTISAIVFNGITLPARSAAYQFVITDFAVSGLPPYVVTGVFAALGTIGVYYTLQKWSQMLTGPGALKLTSGAVKLTLPGSAGIGYIAMILTNYDSLTQISINRNWSPVIGGYII